jgi:hypothetical protein
MSDGLGDRTASSPTEFSDSPLSRVLRQTLILGLFLPVQSGGWSASQLPRTTDWRFDYNAALTKRAEQLGFDLVFGLAQRTSKGGYGGVSKYREDSLDPFTTVVARQAESRPSRIGPISLDMKQMGERSAGNPHAAFDVEGTGDVARHQPKPARQSSTYLGARGGAIPPRDSPILALHRPLGRD